VKLASGAIVQIDTLLEETGQIKPLANAEELRFGEDVKLFERMVAKRFIGKVSGPFSDANVSDIARFALRIVACAVIVFNLTECGLLSLGLTLGMSMWKRQRSDDEDDKRVVVRTEIER